MAQSTQGGQYVGRAWGGTHDMGDYRYRAVALLGGHVFMYDASLKNVKSWR